MSSLMHNLNAVFEDQAVISSNPVDTAAQIMQELDITHQRITELKTKLEIIQQELIGALALTVRRLKPGLNIGANKDGCKVGFKTKHLLFVPEIKNSVWKVKSKDARFANKFANIADHALILNDDLTLLAQAIVAYFNQHYKSLGENICGTGMVTVDGKRSTLICLAEWHQSRKPKYKINSRLVRQST